MPEIPFLARRHSHEGVFHHRPGVFEKHLPFVNRGVPEPVVDNAAPGPIQVESPKRFVVIAPAEPSKGFAFQLVSEPRHLRGIHGRKDESNDEIEAVLRNVVRPKFFKAWNGTLKEGIRKKEEEGEGMNPDEVYDAEVMYVALHSLKGQYCITIEVYWKDTKKAYNNELFVDRHELEPGRGRLIKL